MHRVSKGKRGLALPSVQERPVSDLEEREIVVDRANAADTRHGAQDPAVIRGGDGSAQLDLATGHGNLDLGPEPAQLLPDPFRHHAVRRGPAAEDEPRTDGSDDDAYREKEDLARFHHGPPFDTVGLA